MDTMNLNETKLAAVVENALAATRDNRRWQNAVRKGAAILTSGNPYLHYTGTSLLMLSESGEIYEANGVCQCKAYPMPCKHRAAYKLVKRYLEAAN